VVSYKERKQRFFEEFPGVDEIYSFLKGNFSGNKRIKIKYDVEDRDVVITEFDDENRRLVVMADDTYAPGTDQVIIIFGLVDKYFEVELEVIEKRGPGFFECNIRGGRKGTTGRADIRFKVNSDDVIATNFRISKHTIDVTMFNVPTGIKVILDQFEAQNRSMADVFEVGLLANNPDPVIADIKRTSKTLYVEDFLKDESIVPMNDDFIDLKEIYGRDFPKYLMKMKEKGYRSAIITPIVYIGDGEQTVPFGFISMITKEKILTFDDVISMKDKTFKLVDRIRDANTALVEAKQQILDISKGGARLQIDNPDVKASLMKARGFVFDIIFRLQAPITVYGEVKFTGAEADNSLMVGVSFTGSSSRKDEMKRFYEIMQPMELAYKKKLILQMKGKK